MMRRYAIHGAALAVLVTLAGCGRTGPARPPSAIEVLRQRAQAAPSDPTLQRELAQAELLWSDGDPDRAEAQIGRALDLSPGDPVLHLLAALERHLHGDLEATLDRALSTLERARASDDAASPLVAEVAAGVIVDLRDGLPGYVEAVQNRLLPLVGEPGGMGPGAQAVVARALMELAMRQGDVHGVETLSETLGCVPEWRVAGPFGPRDLLGFDLPFPPSEDRPLAEAYDLGPERGEQPTRVRRGQGCVVHLGDPELRRGGTTYAQAMVEVAPGEAGDHVLRLETPNAVQVHVGDEQVVRLDARRFPTPRVSYHRLRLAEGRHALTVQVTTRHPNPVLDVSLSPGTLPDAAGDGDPVLHTYLGAAVERSRGDVVGARERLRRLGADATGSPLVLLLRAAVALSDGLRPADVRRDDARSLVAAAARRDPEAWLPQLQIARLAAAEGEVVRAIDRLREAVKKWPKVPALLLSLEALLLNRGWEAEAHEVAQRALAQVPDGCPAIRTALSAARRRDRTPEAQALVERLVACDARSDARLDDLVAARQWDDAVRELERLEKLQAPHGEADVLSRRLSIARGAGDDAKVGELVEALAAERRSESAHRLELADRENAAGRTGEAIALLDRAIDEDPASMAGLRWSRHVLGGHNELERFRVDGAEVLRAFEASGRTYDAPQVLVWDYMAVRVFDDGSRFELIHQIHKVQSEEAVTDQGEFTEPGGARLLKLHTIKADGTRLEPDPISGKDSISLPNLAEGDYVESELVRFVEGSKAMPGAVMGGRFFFRNFETPFDRSELIVAVPEDRELAVDPRGPAPETNTRVERGLRVYEWKVTESRPLTPEPMTVAAQEWIPSIGWGIDADWGLMMGGVLDALADKDVVDPAARRLALRVVGDARSEGDLAKAKRLYHWVLENVEDTNDVFAQAAPMLAARTGERHRVLRYLLSLAGVRSTLVLSRSIAGDQTRTEVADEDLYSNLLLMVKPRRADPVFLSLNDRGAPFGFVPAFLRGQEALVLADGAPRVQVPEGEPGSDAHRVELQVRLAADGSAQVEAVETFHGANAIGWRKNLEGVPEAVLEQRFDEGYVSRLVPGARLTNLQIAGRDDPEAPMVLRYTFDTPALGRRQGGAWVVPPLLPPGLAGRYAGIGTRTTTQVVAPPLDQRLTVRLELPAGAKPTRLPTATRLPGPGGAEVRTRTEQKGDTILLERRVRVPLMRVSADDYAGWADFCRAADEATGRELPITMP
jgi:cellulose synthase operon protein C